MGGVIIMNSSLLRELNPALTSFATRFIGLGMQAATLFTMRLLHPAEAQALFFTAQTVLGLQFLAEFGATQAMLQRMRRAQVDPTLKPSHLFFGPYALVASTLFLGLIVMAWEGFYGRSLPQPALLIGALALAGALRLSTVFVEAHVEGSGRINEVYRTRFVATLASQAAMLTGMALLSPMIALLCSTLTYVLFSKGLQRRDVRHFYSGVRLERGALAELLSDLRATGRYQVSLMLSAACGYLIFSGPVIVAGMALDASRVAEIGTSLLLASVASSLCGAIIAPYSVHIMDNMLHDRTQAAWYLERRLIAASAGLFAAAVVALWLAEFLHLRALPATHDLMLALAAYFCFSLGLVFAPGLRALGKDRMLLPSMVAAAAFALLSAGTLNHLAWGPDPLWIFAIAQGAVFLPLVLVTRRVVHHSTPT